MERKDVSSGGSNGGGSDGSGSGSCIKRIRQKGPMDHSSLLIQKWLFKIEKILKLLSTMPTRKRPRRELIYYFVDGCMMPQFHLMR